MFSSMKQSLPIKCFEAFLIGVYLTTGITGLDRFNISFATSFDSIIYRHVVLGVKYESAYGALGLSRRHDLAYKRLNGTHNSLACLIDDFVRAYHNYGHTVLSIMIGLPIVHDIMSFSKIHWRALTIDCCQTKKCVYDQQLNQIQRIWRDQR
jgi:tubulinyl-Tyr carboxypeptidase